MKKLLIKIKDNTLIFKERVKLNDEHKSIINTNVISCNELVFSADYILSNTKIVGIFLQELTKDYNIDTMVIEKIEYVLMILEVIKNVKNINTLIIKENETLTFRICEALVKTNIKNVSCYNIQPFMIEYLDKHNILVESRSEILFLSRFMTQNNLNSFSSLFYKVTLHIELPMNDADLEDFIAFCKINKYLKTIDVNKVNKNDLEFLINTLKKYNKKNIKLVIRDNINDEETINYLRNYNKKKSKKYKIYFKLVYSDKYLQENLIKQTNMNILKFCGILIILIITFTFGYVFYDNYNSMQKVDDIKNEIEKVIENTDTQEIIANIIEEKNDDETSKKIINPDIAVLYNINPEVVGWLTVNNTNIDYAVVQTINNEYYLNHNLMLEPDRSGWIFMDYRDNVEEISNNIIIYGHNRYYSGVMFGTLQNMLRSNWYKNEENQIITFKTLYENLEYQIFSMYKIATTNDYMQTYLIDETERVNFYNMLKDRSIYDFAIDLDKNDKILTLSTCADENNRYVVHAVLKTKR